MISRRSPLIPTLPHGAGLFLLAPSLRFAEVLIQPSRNCSVQMAVGWAWPLSTIVNAVNAWATPGGPVLERERHRAAPDIVFTPLGLVSASRAGWLAVTETITQNCSKTNRKWCFLPLPRLLGLRRLSSAAWAGPGRRIFDAVDGLSNKHVGLRRESDNQGVESLILSTDCQTNTLFYVGKVTTRV